MELPGADSVVEWFGKWPSFHDAEILELHLDRAGQSWIKIHAWNMTNKTYCKEGKQYFVLEDHAIVTFLFSDIVDIDLSGFSGQNVIAGLDIERHSGAFRLGLSPCYGLSGYIDASTIEVKVSPGKPE